MEVQLSLHSAAWSQFFGGFVITLKPLLRVGDGGAPTGTLRYPGLGSGMVLPE